MARKARMVDGSKGTVLVTVKLRLPADVVQGLREESLGRQGSISSLVCEYFKQTPRRFWLQERKSEPAAPKLAGTLGSSGTPGALGQAG